ncbi:MAG: BamA/TamA family outer membrane protein [Candidatus Krumholzibacteriota bacterium]|nr:BamA/TamA family outer membrane protein [Candidatus Krumholzibacteriota bacterium]
MLLAFVAAGPVRGDTEEALPYVAHIDIEGNESFSDGDLKALMRTREPRLFQFLGRPRYLRDWLRSDLATLAAHYHRHGFYDVRVYSLGEEDVVYDAASHSVSIRVRVEEGKRRFLRSIGFEPPLGEMERRLRRRLGLAPGDPFDPESPGQAAYRVLRALQEEGRFSAQVGHRSRVRETPAHAATDSLDLVFQVQLGPAARLGAVVLRGHGLREELIHRELVLRAGEPLRLAAIRESQQNLLDSGYFRSVDYRLEPMPGAGAPPGEEYLRLVWLFRERRMRAFEMGVGVGTVDGLRLLGGWSHRNLLDRGQRLALEGKLSLRNDRDGNFGLQYEREALEWRFLHVVRLRAHLSLTLFREKDYEQETRLTSLETRAIRLSAARRLSRSTVLKVREQFDFLYQRTLSADAAIPEPKYLTRSLTFILDRDTRDHYFHPARGGQGLLSYEWAGGLQGGDHDFHRLQCNLTHHHRSGEGVLASRIFVGFVGAYGASAVDPKPGVPDDGVPFEERFYCGGAASVRGYDENSLGPRLDPESGQQAPDLPGQTLPPYALGGRAMLVGNLEYRFPLRVFGARNLRGVFFVDGGGTWLDWRDISGERAFPWQHGDRTDTRRVFYGVGAGLRYLTPLTVIRVDYGVPLQALADSRGRWHLSLGHAF